MHAVSNHSQPTGVSAGDADPVRRSAWVRSASWLEGLAVALSPAVVALVLRLRLMAPNDLPDPSMHTIYIIDPHDVFTRFAGVYASTARLREGARVGFLVPARLAYLAFGAVPGFLVMRYMLALVAVVPVYLLLRRLYGRPAGVVGILAVLSSPVIVTALGTDYPDSAVVSYLAGGMACLAMPCQPRRRRIWLAVAGVLLTLAVWSHGIAVPLVLVALICYVLVRLAREPARLAGDLATLVVAAVTVTLLLVAAAGVLIGQADFISVTWQAIGYLAQPKQLVLNHSRTWTWAPYLTYLLVPPVVVGAFAIAVAGRYRSVPTPVLLVGVITAVQLLVFALGQFFGTLQALEEHYFSSTLWAGVSLTFAISVAELTKPLADHRIARWVPAAIMLAVPLGYEAAGHLPVVSWVPIGLAVAVATVAAAGAARACGRLRRPWAAAANGVTLTLLVGGILVLTVAPVRPHPQLRHTVFDPVPAYPSALGGFDTSNIDKYQIATALPAFVGQGSYRGEQLMMWRPIHDPSRYNEYSGIYHGGFNSLPSDPPRLTGLDRQLLAQRRPAELLLFGVSAAYVSAAFPAALTSLAVYHPTVLRTGTLRSGPLVLRVWLIRLGVFYRAP